MHYQDGTHALIGDEVVGRNTNREEIHGILVFANAGTDSCNGRVDRLKVECSWASESSRAMPARVAVACDYATIGDLRLFKRRDDIARLLNSPEWLAAAGVLPVA
ncbi:MAG: hypothetical protein K8S98_16570 [Planctomycetes bacterium]|nr:hypothetical protein [Planctomycetota bacterium]